MRLHGKHRKPVARALQYGGEVRFTANNFSPDRSLLNGSKQHSAVGAEFFPAVRAKVAQE